MVRFRGGCCGTQPRLPIKRLNTRNRRNCCIVKRHPFCTLHSWRLFFRAIKDRRQNNFPITRSRKRRPWERSNLLSCKGGFVARVYPDPSRGAPCNDRTKISSMKSGVIKFLTLRYSRAGPEAMRLLFSHSLAVSALLLSIRKQRV